MEKRENEKFISITNAFEECLPFFIYNPLISTTLTDFCLKKIIKGCYMKRYDLYSEMIQQRLFVQNMEDILLNDSLLIFKKEKSRRNKLKINKFLGFKLFKIY